MPPTFSEVIQGARALIRQSGRVSVRALKREFDLDDEALEDLVAELVDVLQVATRSGDVLIDAASGDVAPTPSSPAPIPSAARDLAEMEMPFVSEPGARRQITALFCDLVGSTELASRLDPEDWRDVVREFQRCAAAVIERFDGHIAQYLGDGILVYFGYPSAHEDDAERALRAGLGILSGIGELNEGLEARYGLRLQARLGAHTGPVVVGEMGAEGHGGQALAMGDTPNVAARLQGLAGANQLVMSEATRRLSAGVFVTEDLGEQQLRGREEPVHAYRALRLTGVRSRLDAARENLTPLVGREQELMLLEDRFTRVAEGEGHAVLISGEAGIGKSRLLQAIRDRLAEQRHSWLEGHGSAYTQDTALFPVIETLRQGLDLRPDDSPDHVLRRVETGLSLSRFDTRKTVPLIARLLGVPPGERYAFPDLPPEVLRKQTFDLLIEWLLRLGKAQPLIVLFEDLHWMDASTREFIGGLLDQIPTAPVLLIATFRPDIDPPWGARSHITPMLLSRFTRAQLGDLVRKSARGRTIPDEWVEEVMRRSDGVPLFAEELTRAVLETNPDPDVEQGPSALHIPDTLQESLTARLDALGPVKELAQLGAVLGREFDYPLLLRSSPLPELALREALDAAVREEVFYRRGTPPESSYVFKHALIRDAAYQQMLRSTRRNHHARVANALINQMAGFSESRPELIAHHLFESGDEGGSVPWWLRSAEMASEDMANREAIAHLDRGLQLLDAVPADERARLEFELQILRVKTLTHVRGYAHEDTLASWRRVRAIDQADVDPVRMTSAWSGYCAALLSAGDFEGALSESRELLEFAASTDEPLGQIAGLQGVGFSLFHLGRLAEARAALLEAVEAYDPEGHHFLANGFPTDAGVSASCWLIWVEWLAGRPEASAAAAERANALAARLGNPYTAAFARAWSAVGGVLSRDTAVALQLGDETIAMSDESDFPLLRAIGAFAKHSAEALLGDASGVDRYREAIRAAASAGNRSSVPLIFGTLADCQLAHGLYEDAMASVEAGLSLSAETGQPFYDAELRRIAGEVALARAAASGAEVESCEADFREAMRIACAQGARGLELRGAVSLARALRRAGRSSELADLLEPALEQIEGGQQSSDVRDARALLHAVA